MDIKISNDFSTANLDQMKEVYASVGWTKHTNKIINKFLKQAVS